MLLALFLIKSFDANRPKLHARMSHANMLSMVRGSVSLPVNESRQVLHRALHLLHLAVVHLRHSADDQMLIAPSNSFHGNLCDFLFRYVTNRLQNADDVEYLQI